MNPRTTISLWRLCSKSIATFFNQSVQMHPESISLRGRKEIFLSYQKNDFTNSSRGHQTAVCYSTKIARPTESAQKKKGGNNVSSTGDHTSEESDSHPSQLDSQFPSILGLLLNNLSWGNIVSQISSQLVITQKEKYLLHLPYQKQILQALESLLYLFQIQS